MFFNQTNLPVISVLLFFVHSRMIINRKEAGILVRLAFMWGCVLGAFAFYHEAIKNKLLSSFLFVTTVTEAVRYG